MPDPSAVVEQDIGALVMEAPEAVWKKIKKALAVETREQAASLVQADVKAKEILISLLSGDDSLLTRKKARQDSFLTSPKKERPPLSEQMYGSQKAKAVF